MFSSYECTTFVVYVHVCVSGACARSRVRMFVEHSRATSHTSDLHLQTPSALSSHNTSRTTSRATSRCAIRNSLHPPVGTVVVSSSAADMANIKRDIKVTHARP